MVETTPITLNNLTLHHAVAGEGEPLLLLHGWGADTSLVWPLAEAMNRKGYRCYALDLPGMGKSDEPPQAWTVFDYANLVLAYMDAQSLQQVFLFGHSFGGRLSLIVGAEHPERIRKIALSGSAGVPPKKPLLPEIRLRTYKAIRDGLYNIGAKGLADNLRERYNQRYGSRDFQAVSGVMRQTFVNVVNEDLLPYAARIQASTLLFWGDGDEETPLWMGETLEQTIPDAGLVIHKDAGHYAYLDKLAETARVMDFFFRQQ